MNKEKKTEYCTPEIWLIDIETEGVICVSGDIEPIMEEDW